MHVPVLLTEMGEDDCSSRYVDRLMAWADTHGIGYLAWTWNTPGQRGCRPNGGADGDIFVIASYDGTPFPGMGAGFKAHRRCLASGRCRVSGPHHAGGSAPRSWKPAPRSTFQWQLTGTLDRSSPADVYDVDLFDTPAATVAPSAEAAGHLRRLGRLL